MAKQSFELLDTESGKTYTLETEDDILPSNFRIILPTADGKLALVKDVEDLGGKLSRGDITVGDSNKLDGKSASSYAYADLSNITLTSAMADNLKGYTGSRGADGVAGITGNQGPIGIKGDNGYTGSIGFTGSAGISGTIGFTGSQGVSGSQGIMGYTGSKGATGTGFVISTVFNSLAELLAGTITNDTFGLVAGTLSVDHVDYGKLYHYLNGVWNYITDLSVKGADGITGPQGNQGPIGFTGSQGLTGFTGSTGANGGQGIQGYTGSQGVAGGLGYTGSVGLTGANGSQGVQGNIGYTGSQGATGTQGIIGFTGSVGTAGIIGFTGSKGGTGYNGSQGVQGIIGFTGSQGVAGTAGSIGYTGSKGDTGLGFNISAIFNSLAELLAGTTTNDTFGLVSGTLSPDAEDYGKLYLYKNSTWTYITDMSVKGAAGITGPQGITGYTGSIGVGFTGSAGVQGYTGSQGIFPTELRVDVPANNIDLTTGNLFLKTISGNTTLTVSGSQASGIINSFVLELTNGGSGIITWWSGIKWTNGTAPTLTTAGTDILGFYSYDGGTTWRGVLMSKDNK